MKNPFVDWGDAIFGFCALYGAFSLAFISVFAAGLLQIDSGFAFLIGFVIGAIGGIWTGNRILDVIER